MKVVVYGQRHNVSRQLMAPKVQIVTSAAGRSFIIVIMSLSTISMSLIMLMVKIC